jgi:enamine deaminase RidA (YjgF/YER057c/UK114 family)
MAGTIEKKLTELGITLSAPAAPVANYVGSVRTGDLLVVSGQICLGPDGKLVAAGKLGANVSVEDGQKAARACAVNVLAQLKAALGDLDKVVRVVRLGGFINSAPTFLEGPKVMNGASPPCLWMPRLRSKDCSKSRSRAGPDARLADRASHRPPRPARRGFRRHREHCLRCGCRDRQPLWHRGRPAGERRR